MLCQLIFNVRPFSSRYKTANSENGLLAGNHATVYKLLGFIPQHIDGVVSGKDLWQGSRHNREPLAPEFIRVSTDFLVKAAEEKLRIYAYDPVSMVG
jgi:hypothetical protein